MVGQSISGHTRKITNLLFVSLSSLCVTIKYIWETEFSVNEGRMNKYLLFIWHSKENSSLIHWVVQPITPCYWRYFAKSLEQQPNYMARTCFSYCKLIGFWILTETQSRSLLSGGKHPCSVLQNSMAVNPESSFTGTRARWQKFSDLK